MKVNSLMFLYLIVVSLGGTKPWDFHSLSSSEYPEARCLDGTPGGFYFQTGSGDGAHKFIIMFEGGSWCHSFEDCYARSKTNLGSSRLWKSQFYIPRGLLSDNQAVNPFNYNWNKVLVGYCDGASFSGSLRQPVQVPQHHDEVFFQRSHIIHAVQSTLLKFDFGLNRATEVIISGLSAGGLAVYLHLDNMAAMIRRFSSVPSVKIAGLADAGYFLDSPSIDGKTIWAVHYKNIAKLQNISKSIDRDCLNEFGEKNAWKCFMAENSIKFVDTPLFVVQSLTDSWQATHIMGFKSYNFSQPSSIFQKEVAFMNDYRNRMLGSNLRSFLEHNGGSGGFLYTCWEHTIIDNENRWNIIRVGDVSSSQAFNNWYNSNGKGNHVHIDGKWGENECTDNIRIR